MSGFFFALAVVLTIKVVSNKRAKKREEKFQREVDAIFKKHGHGEY
jgi:hypothetical protein